MNDSRERFEAWAKTYWEPIKLNCDILPDYDYASTRTAWLAWQEAERQMIERCAKVCEEFAQECETEAGFEGQANGAWVCGAIIRALGADDEKD